MASGAAFTLGRDERHHLPQWVRYYTRQFDPADLWVLDHASSDPLVHRALCHFTESGGNVVAVDNDVVFDHDWLLATVHHWQNRLLEQYDYVLYTDTDELVVPAEGTLRDFIAKADQPLYRCIGYEVVEDGMYRSPMFDKTLLASVPLRWNYGYHLSAPNTEPTGELILYHLHRQDYIQAWAKNQRWATQRWDPAALANGWSIQNQIRDEAAFQDWFYDTQGQPLMDWHARLAEALA